MLVPLLVLLLVWVSLLVFLWAGNVWFQGYIYSEPASEMRWRAPAAAAILTAFLGFWAFVNHKSPGKFDTVFRFSPTESVQFPNPLKENESPQFWSEKQGRKTRFELRRDSLGRKEFREVSAPYRTWTPSDAVIVEENGEEIRFEPDRDEIGNYKRPRNKPPRGLGWLIGSGTDGPLAYRDSRGRVMNENDIGHIETFRWGIFTANVILNLLHFGLWFACLWLLLRFQWSHAILLALVLWLVMTLIVVPPLLDIRW